MNTGKVMGFMVNGRTKRIRVYGELSDAGLDLNLENLPKRTVKAIEELRSALQAQCNSQHALTKLDQNPMLNDLAVYGEPMQALSFKPD